METTPPSGRRQSAQTLPAAAGAALVAVGIYAAVALRQPLLAALAGAGGLALLRMAFAQRPYSHGLIVDRRGGLRAVRLSAQRRDRLLAAGGPVDRRLPLQPSLGRHRADRLCRAPRSWRLIGGSRGLRLIEAREPDRGSLPVQPPRDHRGRLAHGRDRRLRHRPCGTAFSRSGGDRQGDHAVVPRRGDADADLFRQRQPAAAFAPLACDLRGERRSSPRRRR